MNSSFRLLMIALFALSIAACNSDEEDTPPPAAPTLPLIEFGSAYEIDPTFQLNGNELPLIAGDSIYVRVNYSGCNENHDFELRHRVLTNNRAELWLEKITPDEDCEAFFEETEIFKVPLEVLVRNRITFVGRDAFVKELR